MKCTTLGVTKKNSTKMGQPYICQQTEESLVLDSSIKGKLRVFQNHRKQAKISVVFHHFPSLGLKKLP